MRVGVTTAADAFGPPAAALRAVGLEPVSLPCIEVTSSSEETLEQIRRAAAEADLLVLTSPRTVRLLWRDQPIPPVPVAVVGSSTAAAVAEAGGEAEIVGRGGAGSLVRLLAPRVRGLRVVFPRSVLGDPEHVSVLERSGAQVRSHPAYHVVPVAPGPDQVDAVVFASPSAVTGWLLSRGLEGMAVAALGATTASALAERGCRGVIIADRPGYPQVAQALAAAVEERRTA